MKKIVAIIILFLSLAYHPAYAQSETWSEVTKDPSLKGYFVIPTNIDSSIKALPEYRVATDEQRRLFVKRIQGGVFYFPPNSDPVEFFPGDALGIILRKQASKTLTNDIIPSDFNFVTSKDSDKDGISDELEKILGTNSRRTDTDGDGFTDKSELLNGYNPIKKGNKKTAFEKKELSGKIFIQKTPIPVYWYVGKEGKRYFMGTEKQFIKNARRLAQKKDLSQLLIPLTENAVNTEQAKARDSKRISDLKIISSVFDQIEIEMPESVLKCKENGSFDQCEGLDMYIANSTSIKDPSNMPVCSQSSAAPCNYSVMRRDGSGITKSNDYKVCFFLEYGDGALESGLHAIISGGKFDSCK